MVAAIKNASDEDRSDACWQSVSERGSFELEAMQHLRSFVSLLNDRSRR
jgi:hypothetical protein